MSPLLMVLYQLVFPLVAALVLVRLLLSGRGRTLLEGGGELRQRAGLLSEDELAPLRAGPVVWLHAASVGEVLAVEALIRPLAAEGAGRPRGPRSPQGRPEAEGAGRPRFLVTTSTVAGRDRAAKIAGVDKAVLAPADFYPAVSAFLNRVSPRSLILIETELWPMMLWSVRRRGIPLGLANGRMTDRAFSRYRWIRGFMSWLLAGFSRAAVQTPTDAARYRGLGLGRQPQPSSSITGASPLGASPFSAIAVTGNVKYDQRLPGADSLKEARDRLDSMGWSRDPCWIAGSTRRGEEEIVVEAHMSAAKSLPGLRLILAPRHPERSKEVEGLLRAAGVRTVRWSQLLPFQSDPECLLVDALGALASLYPVAQAAFVGGTLVPIGGHNLLEPALAGIPVLFGPYTDSVRTVAEELRSSGGGRVVGDAAALASAVEELLGSEDARRGSGGNALETAKRFSGAGERTREHLRPLLFPSADS